jgi:hypothetical protein
VIPGNASNALSCTIVVTEPGKDWQGTADRALRLYESLAPTALELAGWSSEYEGIAGEAVSMRIKPRAGDSRIVQSTRTSTTVEIVLDVVAIFQVDRDDAAAVARASADLVENLLSFTPSILAGYAEENDAFTSATVESIQRKDSLDLLDPETRAMREWSLRLAESCEDDGEEMFLGMPDAWYEEHTLFCADGHVSHVSLGTDDGDRCLSCRRPLVLGPSITEADFATIAAEIRASAMPVQGS